uniref:Leucine-rich repeat protein soc-2 homolog n=1 Tax=Macrostomum lignano TaxID=282301 RepID=A0A1I8HHZ1_9PLAT
MSKPVDTRSVGQSSVVSSMSNVSGQSPPKPSDPRKAERLVHYKRDYYIPGLGHIPQEILDQPPQFYSHEDEQDAYYSISPSGGGTSTDTDSQLFSSSPSTVQFGSGSPESLAGSLASMDIRQKQKRVMVQTPSSKKLEAPRKPTVPEKGPDVTKDIAKCKANSETILDLSGNRLTALPPAVRDLNCVTEMYLYDNKLTQLPDEIGAMVSLEKLMLQQNCLTSLPLTMQYLTKLRVLDLRHNRLENRIPAVIYKLYGLTQLLLTYNKIAEIDPDIGSLISLTVLVVNRNTIRMPIPSSIGTLRQLKKLDLSHNKISEIPDEIGKCILLSDVNLQHNSLTALPESIGELRSLTRLGLKYNQLTSIPKTLANCQKLDEFNIENNDIATLPEGLLSSMKRLTTQWGFLVRLTVRRRRRSIRGDSAPRSTVWISPSRRRARR